MPIQQLRLYDFLVDVFPGLSAIYLIQLIIPVGELPFRTPSASGILIAVILVGAGYLIGRLIHSLSSTFSKILDHIVPAAKYPPGDYSIGNRLWYEFRKSLPVEDREKIVDDFFADDWAPGRVNGPTLQVRYPYVDFDIIQNIKRRFEEVYNFDPENAEERTIRHFAYSELYDSQSLYERYNILATFFRNIAFTFWIAFIITLTQYLMYLSDTSGRKVPVPWLQEQNSWILLIFLFAVSVISSRQLFKYSFRRNRHLVIDFYNTITDSDTE
ncbi:MULTISPECIES: hypothetical protein [Halobacterium]|uniref:hypothetical protein n=1 Tax=Halobacterium TaxID=2239 RepID=UPI000A469DDA|nr:MULTISPECIES: hypothetical protein [Halobacterium]MCG1001894.1 hypothetical protein [Halobacterium noricense]